jgi:hypothetical protein
MSKRVQRYECGECESNYPDKAQADGCERDHAADREQEACDKLVGQLSEELWLLTLPQLHELLSLVRKMIAAQRAPAEPTEDR